MFEYIKNDQGLFICPHYDNYSTPNQSTMHYHLKAHEGPFTCPHCNKEYKSEASRNEHILDAHPKGEKKQTFLCPVPGCGHESKQKGNRIPHFLRNHCGDVITSYEIFNAETQTSTCTLCQKQFSMKQKANYIHHLAKCMIVHQVSPHELLPSIL
jgi:hypothetical protein